MPKQQESKFRTYVQQGRQYPLHTDRRPCLLQLCSAGALSAAAATFLYLFFWSMSTVPSPKIAAAADRTNEYIKIQWIKKFDDFMYVVYGIIGTSFQHFMSALSKDLSDSAKEERIGWACNKSRRRDARPYYFASFLLFIFCQRSW